MSKKNKRIAFNKNPQRPRLIGIFIVLTGVFVVVLGRLFSVQIIENELLKKLTQKQGSKIIRLASPRGTIFDSHQRALAVSIKVPSVYADPSRLEITDGQKKKLLTLLSMSQKTWLEKIKNKNRQFVWLERKADPSLAKEIDTLNIKGVSYIQEWNRMYPDRENASQVLGFVNLDGEGVEGIERQYEHLLFSHTVELQSRKDARGRPILDGKNLDLERRRGFDLILTIDSVLQHFLEEALLEASIDKGVESSMGILMDPHTGQVKAMASYPRMNPNRIDQSTPKGRKNRNVLDTYEPGSTFKAFVMLEALEQNLVSLDKVMDCSEDSLVVAGKKFRNPVRDKDHLTPRGIIKYSNNVCMAKIGLEMGKEGLLNLIEKLGFAQKTRIDFPSEASGIFYNTKIWRDTRIANLAFGQGISVTAIQMARAMSVIANGGFWVQPYIVDRVVSGTNEMMVMAPQTPSKRIYSEQAIEKIQDFLIHATLEDGTAKNATVPGYLVSGKTGTAQVFDVAQNKYSRKEVVSSFLGYAPSNQPALVGYIVLQKPEKSEHGGTIAAPVFSKVMSQALPYLHFNRDHLEIEKK